MKNVLILHSAGNNSNGSWYLWLKKVLEDRGLKVWLPDLPNSDTPDQDVWTDFIFSNKDWEFNEESILVGHSAGATLILRLLEKLPGNVKINKAILVAAYVNKGTIPEYFQYKTGMLKTLFDWNKIKNSCEQFYFIHSDNDKYQCGLDQGEVLKENLGGELIVKPGAGHFNLEHSPKYKQFPAILEYI